MSIQKWYPPVLDNGIHETFFTTSSFTLPPGKRAIWSVQQNQPNSVYLNAGATHINLNAGRNVTESGLPAANRAMFIPNPELLKNYNPNKPLSQFSQAECQSAVQAFLTGRGGSIDVLTSGAEEAYGDMVPWRQDSSLPQYAWIDQAFASLNAGDYYGNYSGHLNLIGSTSGFTDTSGLRAGFTDANVALAICKANTGFGNPFFTGEAWRFRNGLINIYYNAHDDPFRKMCQNLAMYTLHQKAMQATGVSRRLMAFGWSGADQILGDGAALCTYQVPVPGGHTTWTGFYHYSARFQAAQAFLAFLFCDDFFSWEDGYRRGYNPAVLDPDVTYSGSASPSSRSKNLLYDASGATFPPSPQGTQNGTPEGWKMYADAVAWAGTTAWQWVRSRPSSSGNYTSNDATFVLDRALDRAPLAVKIGGSGNRSALFIYPDGAGQFQTRDYDIGTSAPVTLETNGLTPHLLLIDSSTTNQ